MSIDKHPPIYCIAQYKTSEIVTLCARKIADIVEYRSTKSLAASRIKARLIAKCREDFSKSIFYKSRVNWTDQQIWNHYRDKHNASLLTSTMPSEYTETLRLSRYYAEYQMDVCNRIKQAAVLCKEEKMWLTDEGIKYIL